MKITTSQAARVLDMSVQMVRLGLQNGSLPIGRAIKKPKSTTVKYYISPEKLAKEKGVSVADLERMLAE